MSEALPPPRPPPALTVTHRTGLAITGRSPGKNPRTGTGRLLSPPPSHPGASAAPPGRGVLHSTPRPGRFILLPMADRELGAGAWSYFGDPRAISHDGHTFTGWISTIGNVWVARYTKGGRLSKRVIFKGLGRDDHNNPSLVFRDDGHLVVFFSPHSGHNLPPKGIPKVM